MKKNPRRPTIGVNPLDVLLPSAPGPSPADARKTPRRQHLSTPPAPDPCRRMPFG
jgi:hypothetical protein